LRRVDFKRLVDNNPLIKANWDKEEKYDNMRIMRKKDVEILKVKNYHD